MARPLTAQDRDVIWDLVMAGGTHGRVGLKVGRHTSVVQGVIAATGGVRPAVRCAPEPELARNLFPVSVIDDPQMSFFNGYVSERDDPVATAFGVVAQGVAGVYGVTVHPDLRHTGLGTAMTWAAVQFGATAGTDIVALQASAMGKPVDEAMGFQTVLTYLRFAFPQPVLHPPP